jgi:DNA polymerase III alpha subunit
LHNLDMMLAFASRIQKQASSGQVDLFGNSDAGAAQHISLELQPAPAVIEMREQLLWERELLGLYLSQHPLQMFETFLKEKTVPIKELKGSHDGKPVTVGGAIVDVREITTKNGQKMAFIKMEDQTGEIEVILFPSAYQQTIGLWQRDRVVLIHGKINGKDREGNPSDEAKVMVDDAREITSAQAQAYQETGRKARVPKPTKAASLAAAAAIRKAAMIGPGAKAVHEISAAEKLYIRLRSSSDTETLLSLKQMIDADPGDTEVILVLGDATNKQAIKLPGGFNHQSDSLGLLRELVGPDNLVLR